MNLNRDPVKLNRDQNNALKAIMQAYDAQPKGGRYLLDGAAGTGKTTLLRVVAEALREREIRLAVCAPTHKAVGVLRIALHGPHSHAYEFNTVHSLLGLTLHEDGQPGFSKRSEGRFEDRDVIIIDECSMLDSRVQHHIDDLLGEHFVLYVGDQGQIPPVGGGDLAPCFATPAHTTLTRIVRQARGNPIIKMAAQMRARQGEVEDFAWCQQWVTADQGVYVPSRTEGHALLKDAFTSEKFREDKNAYRILAYRNKTVAAINQLVRGWIYGRSETPFVVGEQVLCRQPVGEGRDPLFKTNEEGIVASIERVTQRFEFPAIEPFWDGAEHEAKKTKPLDAWDTSIEVWKVQLRHLATEEYATAFMAADVAAANKVKQIEHALYREARQNHQRWRDRYRFQRAFSELHPCYAMTVHCAQGSTFETVFLQVADMAQVGKPHRGQSRSQAQLEMQKLFYTAVTRPSHNLVLLRTELVKPASAPLILPTGFEPSATPLALPQPREIVIPLPDGHA